MTGYVVNVASKYQSGFCNVYYSCVNANTFEGGAKCILIEGCGLSSLTPVYLPGYLKNRIAVGFAVIVYIAHTSHNQYKMYPRNCNQSSR